MYLVTVTRTATLCVKGLRARQPMQSTRLEYVRYLTIYSFSFIIWQTELQSFHLP